jgi:hypothetical protein
MNIITLGIGTPSGIAAFILVGLSPSGGKRIFLVPS